MSASKAAQVLVTIAVTNDLHPLEIEHADHAVHSAAQKHVIARRVPGNIGVAGFGDVLAPDSGVPPLPPAPPPSIAELVLPPSPVPPEDEPCEPPSPLVLSEEAWTVTWGVQPIAPTHKAAARMPTQDRVIFFFPLAAWRGLRHDRRSRTSLPPRTQLCTHRTQHPARRPPRRTFGPPRAPRRPSGDGAPIAPLREPSDASPEPDRRSPPTRPRLRTRAPRATRGRPLRRPTASGARPHP